ncbi:MAG: molybdopterin-dependent oxidoreductase [Promethearchaeota archaeon]
MKVFESRSAKRDFIIFFLVITIGVGAIIVISFTLDNQTVLEGIIRGDFPDFITRNEDYYITRIGEIPEINPSEYRLHVWGEINNSKYFTLSELFSLELIEKTLTTECIGNQPMGPLISTAVWGGFLIFDLLESLGLKENATGVKYRAADGYYVSHTIDQLRDLGTLGALYMNGEILPANQGFPLRVVTPGAYGAKQPAWVIEIEVIDRPLEDFYDDFGAWDTSPPMDVDSTIFFPYDSVRIKIGSSLEIGGAAFGGTRISKVEYHLSSLLNGDFSWKLLQINESIDVDHVWVFWKTRITFNNSGNYQFYSKATDIHNNTQPRDDSNHWDGTNSWPSLAIIVE